MTSRDTRAEEREALERLLEVHGADRTRWPARERLRFASFICEDEDARRLVTEAAALDRLLDLAPTTSIAREKVLADRIMAAALSDGARQSATIGRRGAIVARLPVWARKVPMSKVTTRSEWPAAALLAASLVIGVMLGSAGTFESTTHDVAEVTGFATADTSSQLALSDGILAASEEDVL